MSTKNLSKKEADAKLKELVESIDFCMMATNLSSKPLHIVPMSTKKIDGEEGIWFLSGKDSDHNQNIVADSEVQLIYSMPSKMEFLNLYGRATIKTDRLILEELYDASDDSWFDGVDDPNLTAICFKPSHAYYWDTKDNQLVSLLKMGYGAVTGQKVDVGEEGKLNM